MKCVVEKLNEKEIVLEFERIISQLEEMNLISQIVSNSEIHYFLFYINYL